MEPGRWSFRKDPTVTTMASTKNNPLADVKIAKLSPSSKKTTNQDYIAQTSVLDSGSRRGAGAAGNRSFRGGRGGGGQQSYNNPPMRDNNNGESPRKVGFDRETNNRMVSFPYQLMFYAFCPAHLMFYGFFSRIFDVLRIFFPYI